MDKAKENVRKLLQKLRVRNFVELKLPFFALRQILIQQSMAAPALQNLKEVRDFDKIFQSKGTPYKLYAIFL